MYKTSLLLVLLTLLGGTASGQDAVDPASAGPRSGLEFQIGNDFQLQSFVGTMISWKTLRSPTRGWRVGLSPRITSSQRRDDGEYTGYAPSETQNKYYGLGAEIQWLHLAPLEQKLRSYWGLGPVFSYDYRENRRSSPDDDGAWRTTSSRIERAWLVGALALIGVEYFVLPDISLHGEYGFEVRYRSQSSSQTEITETSWQVATRSVRLGLSVLF